MGIFVELKNTHWGVGNLILTRLYYNLINFLTKARSYANIGRFKRPALTFSHLVIS